MSGDNHSHDDIKSHIPLYLKVGLALFVLTIVTVAIGMTHIESIALAVIIGMAVASVKGGLVAAVYMHLMGEKKIIMYTLALTVFFFIVCLSLPVLTHLDGVGAKSAPPVKVNSAHYGHEGHGHDGHGHEGEEGHGEEGDHADHAEESESHAEVGESQAEEAPAESH